MYKKSKTENDNYFENHFPYIHEVHIIENGMYVTYTVYHNIHELVRYRYM